MPAVSDLKVFTQQVQQIYQQAIAALIGMPSVALVTALLLWQEVEQSHLLAWVAMVLGLSLVRLWLVLAYRREPIDTARSTTWAKRYFFLEMASGFTWALLVYWLFPSSTVHQVLVLLVLGGMATGATPMLIPVKQIYAAYLFSAGIVSTLSLFAYQSEYTFYLGMAAAVYTVVLWLASSLMSDRNVEAIRLSLENGELIESMKLANQQLVKQVRQTLQAEYSVRNAEARFRTLANATNEGVVLYEHGYILDGNQRLTEMLGYAMDEIVRKPVQDLFDQADRALVTELMTHKDGVTYELHCLRKDGSRFPVELNKRRMDLEDRAIYILTLHDITALREITELKDQFVSTVSHELRTPLTSIHASLGLVLGGVTGELPQKANQLLGIAQQNSERLSALINDLLDIQKIDAGMLNMRYEVLDIMEVVRQALTLNAAFGSKYQTRYVIGTEVSGIAVHADRSRLLQVFTNLLSNAAKFSPADTEVNLDVGQQGDTVQVAITDHGPGIPEQFRNQIFGRFAQADASTTRNYGGSGLGLYICRELLRQMHGQIDFRSQVGRGTTFFFTLPVYAPEP